MYDCVTWDYHSWDQRMIYWNSPWIRWPQDRLCRKARIVSSTETCHSNQSHGECLSWMYNAFRYCDFPYALCLFKNLVKYQTQTSEMSSKDGKEQKKPWKSIKRPNHSPNQLEKPPQLCLAVPPSSHQRASGDRSIGDSRWVIERCSSTWNFMSGFPYYPTVPKQTWWLPQREMIHNTSHFATGRNSANLWRPIWMNYSLHVFHKLLSSYVLVISFPTAIWLFPIRNLCKTLVDFFHPYSSTIAGCVSLLPVVPT